METKQPPQKVKRKSKEPIITKKIAKKIKFSKTKQTIPQWVKNSVNGVPKLILDRAAHIVYLARIYVGHLDENYFKIGISDCGLENHLLGLNSHYNSKERIVLISAFVESKNRLTKTALREMFKYQNIQYQQDIKIASTRPTIF